MIARAIQAPLQCWKKSSPGLTDESIADMSRPAGGYSGPWKLAGTGGAAGAVDTASSAAAVIRQSERIDIDMDRSSDCLRCDSIMPGVCDCTQPLQCGNRLREHAHGQ